ncbi:aminotransferase class IV [Agrococcus carbonis]|uniref:4-amino-4-deoxychorismate lyase n=1 Tax=Agrococcus carbonis TaxID=684552 RepID=A0A1H1T6V9_9MICO|nr:aminotransferase class IV [Agrococcus carbonis]SDS55911.1 4-amino-4-deoxychorismate lyase [Agrococcus carbonis]
MSAPLLALLDGSIVDVTQPIVRADDLGVVRGDGVFDATLARRGADGVPEVRDREAHLDRLERSAQILQLPVPDRAGFERAMDALVAAWDFDAAPEAIIRLVLTRGPEGGGDPTAFALMAPLGASAIAERDRGVSVTLLGRGHDGDEVAAMPWLLPGAKSLSYSINMAAKRHAAQHGFDDVVFVSPAGLLLEGPTSTLVVDRGGRLLTPRQDGILASITLDHLMRDAPAAGLDVAFAALEPEDLTSADGAWLLSSGRLLARVTSVDGRPLPTSPLDAALRRVLGV